MIDIRIGDMRILLRDMVADSVDSCVTDPPYHLTSIVKRFGSPTAAPAKSNGPTGAYERSSKGFMGQTWDGGDVAFNPETWTEVYRVLKPGAHLLAFAATKNAHRLTCAIEDAGFEIRDVIMWLYGSGFPKSHNLEGEWEGWGTALKPAYEPVIMARKPLVGTVAANVEKHGVGAININASRIEGIKGVPASPRRADQNATFGDLSNDPGTGSGWDENVGRWPANIIHDGSDEVLEGFPHTKSGTGAVKKATAEGHQANAFGKESRPVGTPNVEYGDEGSAARFFYCAKTSKFDRDEGLNGFKPVTTGDGRAIAADNAYQRGKTERRNNHPTVKPTDLMRYLCRLVTPPGGLILDPFMGSGSTGKAAMKEGFRFVGCELSNDYAEIARARILAALPEYLQ